MNPIDLHELLLFGTVIALVLLAVFTGQCLNRFLTHRAHRRALEELRRRAIESAPPVPECTDRVAVRVETRAKA